TKSRTNARLLRWIDAIFAHRHAPGHELAVVAHACAAEDRRTGLQVGAAAGREVVVLGFRRHQDLLLAVLVLERELLAAARLREGGGRGEGKQDKGEAFHSWVLREVCEPVVNTLILRRIPCSIHSSPSGRSRCGASRRCRPGSASAAARPGPTPTGRAPRSTA